MSILPSHKKRYALRLALADVAFGHAQSLTEFILGGAVSEDSEIYPGVVAGVVIHYTRPFMQADGLGPLPNEFSTLPILAPDIQLQLFHNDLMGMRNILYAHADHIKLPTLLSGIKGARAHDEIELHFTSDGFSLTTTETLPPIDRFKFIRSLIVVQRQRLTRKLTEHMIGWIGPLPPTGKFKITDKGIEPV